jgi:DNA-binding transcriptional regulator YiaG
MKKKYQSEILMVCHQDAEALHRIGAITDEEMAEYDRDCLVMIPPKPGQTFQEATGPAKTEHSKAATAGV